MSGPVTTEDAVAAPAEAEARLACIEVVDSHLARVGAMTVCRALPCRARRTVGAWCFVDHMGPVAVTEDRGVDIGPHPHIGLQTVTWLVAGEVLHRDSLGSEQVVRPGQLNLMTAGRGVSHSEEATGTYRGDLHGVQLWVAQPEETRHGDPAFEHHGELPRFDLDNGVATVLVGEVDGLCSPARRDTDHLGLDLDLAGAGTATIPLSTAAEHALVVLRGVVHIDGTAVDVGRLAYLGTGRDELALTATERARALLLGGTPFPEPLLMWWNFVARTREEISTAFTDWHQADDRFGTVATPLARIPTGPPPWLREDRP